MTRLEALENLLTAAKKWVAEQPKSSPTDDFDCTEAESELAEAIIYVDDLPTPSQRAGRPELVLSKEQVSTALERLLGANGSYSDPFGEESRPITKLCKDWLALEAYCDTLESQRAGSDTEGALEAYHLWLMSWMRLAKALDPETMFDDVERDIEKCYDPNRKKEIAAARELVSRRRRELDALSLPTTPTTPATSDEGEKPPQRSLEGGSSSESLPPPHHPQGQRAEQICEECGGDGVISCPEEKGSGYAKTSDLCPRCCGSGRHPTPCDKCKGRGSYTTGRSTPEAGNVKIQCEACHGSGERPAYNEGPK